MTHPARTAEWITSADRFAELAEPWDQLADLEGTPFSTHAWFSAWDDAFSGDRLSTPTVWQGETLLAAMPMSATRRGLAAMANAAHSPFIRPLARDPGALEPLEDLLFSGPARSVSFSCLPEVDAEHLADAARKHGRLVHVEAELTSPIVETDGDFDSWRALSEPRWHSPLERYRRKMNRDHEASFELLRSPRALDAQFERGLELERAGWKGRAGTAVLSKPDTTRFYRAVAGAFATRGELNLSSISLDGRMVAFDLSLLHRNRLYLLKTAHDESMRRLAPGMVLRLAVIERCFESGIEAHELLGGSEDYKLKFSTAARRHVGMRCYRRLPGPMARYGYEQAVRPRLRTAYRALRSRSTRG